MKKDLAHMIFQAVAGIARCKAHVIDRPRVMLPRTSHGIRSRTIGWFSRSAV
jgi:hypothetical protein